MDDPACIICDEHGGDMRTIQQKAVNKLIDSSKKRRDRKYTKWVEIKSASVHKRCSDTYNRESAISAAAAQHTKKTIEGKSIVKDALHFEFETLCFICGIACNNTTERVKVVTKSETRDRIIKALEERKDLNTFQKKLFARLNATKDLVQVQARYHAKCMSTFYVNRLSDQIGRPASESTINFIEFAINYIEQNKSDSQFSLNEIKNEFTGIFPDLQTIKSKLMKFYPDDQLEFVSLKTDLIILFRHKISKKCWKEWYSNQEKDPELERKRIVQMAGNIILQDIRKTIYNKNSYTLPNFNEKNIFDNIPESLADFLSIVFKTHKNISKKNDFKWKKRIATIAHTIIMLARPRSFLSPILLGLSSMMHKKYASRDLIDSLSYLGLCATYEETLRFEASIVNDPDNHTCDPECFVQYIFDNADHNTCTIDGKNTFHAMGGIKVATPSSSVISKQTIARLNKIPSSSTIGKFGFTQVKRFEKKNAKGLNTIFIQNIFRNDLTSPKISMEDFTWLYSKYTNKTSKGYSGFMEDFYINSDYTTSKIIPLPFVNNPPSDYDTIFTVLVQAAEENKQVNKENICFVTFDQPLYQKARYILACVDLEHDPHGLSNIRVRLGGFHTLMSFLATIGFIMNGSGLKEAFCVIYAENSAEKAFVGHAYSRAIRAHFLVQIALATIIFESLELTEEEKVMFDALLLHLGTENFKEDMQKEEFTIIRDKFVKQIEEFKKRGPTAELWIQYWVMLTIVKDFIKAERSGNWDLHLKCIERMIPYFHASGHNNYAKSSHLYLQDMLNLKHEMNEYQYELFTTNSYFTVRRSEKFWSGVWSDMTIEQVLMRSMKTQGGLTHGRGMSESVLTKFVLTMIILVEVCNEMENFCNVSYSTSEQHIDSTEFRIARDATDLEKLLEFFNRYYPFPEIPNIMSVFSGVIGNDSVNCHRAYEEGMKSVKSIIGKDFGSVKFTRKNKVLSIASVNSSVKVNDETIAIDPLLLFQRLCVSISSKEDMKKYLKFELAPFPLSLCTENGLKKNVKSQLFQYFTNTESLPAAENIVHVIDGGFLLHKVVWQKNDTIEVINEKYLSFVRNHYADNSCIIFDGYPDNETDNENLSSTKTTERLRRQNLSSVPVFNIEPHTKVTLLQEKFLSNAKNKNELIKQLSKVFRFEGYTIKQAEEDADSLIINSAIEIAEKNKLINAATGVAEYKKTVLVVGQDIDLLVLLNQLNSTNAPIFFFKPGAGNVNDSMFSSNSFTYEDYRSIVAFLHCFTGCDTTSAFAGKGKKTTFNALIKTPGLTELVKPFYQTNAEPTVIAQNGCTLISSIYKCTNDTLSLDDLRFQQYKVLTAKSTFKLEKLPPTVGAAIQHSYRAYFQLQTWLGNKLRATKWGWKEVIANNTKILMPYFTEMSLIPEDLLKTISCNCETSCQSNRCGCRKHGLRCTHLCSKCYNTDNCSNVDKIVEDFIDCNEFEQPSICLNSDYVLPEEISDMEEAIEDQEEIILINEESRDQDDVQRLPKKPRLQ